MCLSSFCGQCSQANFFVVFNNFFSRQFHCRQLFSDMVYSSRSPPWVFIQRTPFLGGPRSKPYPGGDQKFRRARPQFWGEPQEPKFAPKFRLFPGPPGESLRGPRNPNLPEPKSNSWPKSGPTPKESRGQLKFVPRKVQEQPLGFPCPGHRTLPRRGTHRLKSGILTVLHPVQRT